jgi:4-hydroxy-L-threonine phosphate dehydrogenase PdxA
MSPSSSLHPRRPLRFAVTLGDPAGIGPEIALRALSPPLASLAGIETLLVGERAALDAVRALAPDSAMPPIVEVEPGATSALDLPPAALALVDPVRVSRPIAFGASGVEIGLVMAPSPRARAAPSARRRSSGSTASPG